MDRVEQVALTMVSKTLGVQFAVNRELAKVEPVISVVQAAE